MVDLKGAQGREAAVFCQLDRTRDFSAGATGLYVAAFGVYHELQLVTGPMAFDLGPGGMGWQRVHAQRQQGSDKLLGSQMWPLGSPHKRRRLVAQIKKRGAVKPLIHGSVTTEPTTPARDLRLACACAKQNR
jgi:hypothetical protein